MQSPPNYLVKRISGIYHFRMAVPKKLQQVLGKTEFHHSLRTREPRTARILAGGILDAIERLMNQSKGVTGEMDKKSVLASMGIDGDITELVTINGVTIDRPDLSAQEEIKLAKELVQELGMTQPAPQQAVVIAQAPQQPVVAGLSLSELYKEFKLQEAGAWGKKTELNYDAKYQLMFDLLEDCDVKKVIRPVATGLRNMLLEYPANANKLKQFKGLKALEVYAKNTGKFKVECLSQATVNLYIQRMHQLFRFAVVNEYLDRNPFVDLTITIAETEDDRRAFDDHELEAIFGDPIFTKLRYRNAYQYWIPILGYFTGARINEIAGLATSDIYEEHQSNGGVMDIIHFRFRKQDGHRLKTKNSIRKIPIHPELVRLGFLKFVEKRKAIGEFLLFDVNQDEFGGYAKNAGSWFNDRYLKKLGIKDKSICFHSFRHTAQVILQKNSVPAELRSAYLGHSLGDGAQKDGGSATTISTYGISFPAWVLETKVIPHLPFPFNDVLPFDA